MDAELARLIDEDTPKLNPIIAHGFAVSQVRKAERFIDDVIRSVSKEFPPEFQYAGMRRCLPWDEYREAVRKRGPRSTYDIANTSFYMVRCDFKFQGQLLKKPKFIYLPYISDACTVHISNGRYLVSPVLTDRVISIGVSNIFIRLLRDRMTFERVNHHVEFNGKGDTIRVPWVMAYHKTEAMKKLKPTVKMNCALVHYQLAKYGFFEMFRRFGHTTPVIGPAQEITRDRYPRDQWVICNSTYTNTTQKPKGAAKGFYAPTMIRVAIKREEFTPIVKQMIGGFFYVVDHFPDMVEPEYIDGSAHETRMWRILLGCIIYTGTYNHGRLALDMDTHLRSLDDYIDSIMIDRFREIDMPITDLYQLFSLLIENFDRWILEGADKVNSMYDKELNVNGFLLELLTFQIIKMNFRLKTAAQKELKERDVENALAVIKTGELFKLTKTSGCLSTTSSPGDNKAFKLTSILIPQSSSHKGAGGKDRGAMNDPAMALHVSVAEIGGYTNIPKSEPSGRARLNPHVQLSDKYVVQRHEDLREMLDETQEMIK